MSGAAGAPTISRNSSVNDSDIIFVEDMPIDGDSSCGCGVYRGQFNLALNVQHGQGRMVRPHAALLLSLFIQRIMPLFYSALIFMTTSPSEIVVIILEHTYPPAARQEYFSDPDIASYDGEWVLGSWQGTGTLVFHNNDTYIGEFVQR